MEKDDFSVWDLEEDEIDDITGDIEDDDEDKPSNTREVPRNKKRIDPKSKRPQARSRTGKDHLIKNKAVIWAMRIAVVVVVLMLLFLPSAALEQAREDSGLYKLRNLLRPYREFPEWVRVSVSVQYDLTISSGIVDLARIKTAIPFDIMDEESGFRIQNVTRVSMVPDPTFPLPDYNTDKNRISGWEVRNDGYATLQFIAEFDLDLYTYRWKIDEEDSGTVADIPNDLKTRYLDDEWEVKDGNGDVIDRDLDSVPDFFRYHPSHPIIKATAEQITKDEMTVLGMVRSIYDWMQANFNYTTNEQRDRDAQIYGSWPKYPLGTLADWYGDCDDQSLLMASLCRAVGIPAWLEIGYLYDPMEGTWGGHGWFNVAIPVRTGSGYEIVVAPIDPVNHEFLFRDPYRITDWIDTGGDMTDLDGDVVFNLDFYYNYFKVTRNNFVDVKIRVQTSSLEFDRYGLIKEYVDQKMAPANLPGTEGGVPELPFPLVVLAVPAVLSIVPWMWGRKRTA